MKKVVGTIVANRENKKYKTKNFPGTTRVDQLEYSVQSDQVQPEKQRQCFQGN